MKNFLLTLSITAAAFHTFSQQQPVLSQYMLSPYYFNPAYTGSGALYDFSLLHRSQWSGYQDYEGHSGAPQMQVFTATANLDSAGHSFGLLLSRDKAGLITAFQAQVSYGYRISLTEKSTLAFAMRAGIATRLVDYDRYIILHPDDNLIQDGKQSETQPDVALGVWYEHQKYYAGISARGIVVNTEYRALGIESERDLMITAGYHVGLTPAWSLTPSFQMITNLDRATVQGSLLADYNNAFWAGVSYRHEDAVSLIAGFSTLEKKFRLTYAFDYITSNQSVKAGTSHEIMITCQVGRLRRLSTPVRQ